MFVSGIDYTITKMTKKEKKREKVSVGRSKKIMKEVRKSAKSFVKIFPTLLGTMLLVSLITTMVPKTFYHKIFTGSIFDPVIGSLIGGVSAGNPIISYIIGGELLKNDTGLLAVTAFIVAWVTVGIIQLPAESMLLGKRFAITRNFLSFVFAIITALTTVLLINLIGRI